MLFARWCAFAVISLIWSDGDSHVRELSQCPDIYYHSFTQNHICSECTAVDAKQDTFIDRHLQLPFRGPRNSYE